MWYDRHGHPIDAEEWGRLHRDPRYRTVAVTSVGGMYVSTVWLGIDHGWGHGPPVIFETMVFAEDDDGHPVYAYEHYCERYTTEADARAGHEVAVTWVIGAG